MQVYCLELMQSSQAKRWIPFVRFFCHVEHTTFQLHSLSPSTKRTFLKILGVKVLHPLVLIFLDTNSFRTATTWDTCLGFPARRCISKTRFESLPRGPGENFC